MKCLKKQNTQTKRPQVTVSIKTFDFLHLVWHNLGFVEGFTAGHLAVRYFFFLFQYVLLCISVVLPGFILKMCMNEDG